MNKMFGIVFLAASSAFAAPASESIKLYDAPATKPTQGCDVHTLMTINRGGRDSLSRIVLGTITLEERVSGFCEIYVPANSRSYKIEQAREDSGDVTLLGSGVGSDASIRVRDHRASTYEVKYSAGVEVTEHLADGASVTLFSER